MVDDSGLISNNLKKRTNSIVNSDNVVTAGTGTEVVSNNQYGCNCATGTGAADSCRAYRDHIGALSSEMFVLHGHGRTSAGAQASQKAEWGTTDGATAVLMTTQDTCSFYHDNTGNWKCRTGDGTTQKTTTTSVAFAVSTTYRFMIISYGAVVEFYINGTLVATHTTNIPNSGTQYPSLFIITSSAASKTFAGEIHMEVFAP